MSHTLRDEYLARKAQHRCTGCGKQDEHTLSGKTKCLQCSGTLEWDKKRQRELVDVFLAYGYKVSAPEPEKQDDGTDMDPEKMRVLSKYGYDYSVLTGRWTTAS